MNEPRDLVQRLDENPQLPKGNGEILSGYGVESCPFASGDILCSRHVRNLSAVAPLREQLKLGDFWIPRTGLFAIERTFFDAFDPEIHSAATSRTESAAPESSTKLATA